MSRSKMQLLLALALCVAAQTVLGTPVYFPEFCANMCPPGNFIEPLPVATGPVGLGGNRANAWTNTLLIQAKPNVPTFSPPGSARIAAIYGSCLYEAALLAEETTIKSKFNCGKGFPHFACQRQRSNTELKDAYVDGAGYWALYRIFGDRPTFSRVFSDYTIFSGMDIRPLVPLIEAFIRARTTKTFASLRVDSRIEATLEGAASCERIIRKYTADGFAPDGNLLPGDPDPTGYEPVNAPQFLAGITNCEEEITDRGRWQPLCVGAESNDFGTSDCTPQSFATPWAGRYTPFAIEEGDETTGGTLVFPPTTLDSPRFIAEYEQVLEISGGLDDIDKSLAEYWADGIDLTTPPLHLWKIAADAAIGEGFDCTETAKILFVMGNVVYDAGIASWRSKVTYDFVRPLQMIQCGGRRNTFAQMWLGPYLGTGLGSINEWRPFQAADFKTPPFAGFTSGHSTFTNAFAVAMASFFGDDKYRGPACHFIAEGDSLFEPESDEIPGVSDIPNTGPDTIGYVPAQDTVLCWDTWNLTAVQSGLSRLQGGIHVQIDDDGGIFMGKNAGNDAFSKAISLARPSDFCDGKGY